LHNERLALTRVDSTSSVDTQIVDLTPRAGEAPDSPVLKVQSRAEQAINKKIDDLEATMNASTASTGNRALFAGLTKINFGQGPVTIVSSGLDLASPVDFRKLNWIVPPHQVVDSVRQAGELPDLHRAPVRFVLVPPAAGQEQLRAAQKRYLTDVWTALLDAGNASSVTFIDANGVDAASATPAPAVAVPTLPGTPVEPVTDPADPKRTLCRLVSSTYFEFDSPALVDRARTIADLRPCIETALATGAALELDGWASYEGALSAEGKPITDFPKNRALSTARAQTIADLLVRDLEVPRNKITRITGHGNTDQPDPDPRSPANRLVVVSYVTR
jgi:hypothetical protein